MTTTENNNPTMTNQNENTADDNSSVDNPPKTDETDEAAKTDETDEAAKSDKKTEEEQGADKKEEADKKEGEGEEQESDLFGKPEAGYNYTDMNLPEGYELNKEITEKFNAVAEKYNMSQKGASEIMTLAVEHTKHVQSKIEDSIRQAHEQKISEYKTALETDKEIGGNKLQETLDDANDAYDKFADKKKVQDLFLELGINNHPEVVRMFAKIGKLTKNDKINNGGNPPPSTKTHAQILYGDTTSKKE